jgi:ABC-2 type transport system permease protein
VSELTGTAPLTRFVVRRDRVRMIVWVLSLVGLVVLTVASVKGLYPTQQDLDKFAAASRGNAAAIAFNGPDQALNTLGGQIAFQTGSFGLVLTGLMSVLMVGRLARGEEEAGRVEMVRSLPVGSEAPFASVLFAVMVTDVVVGVGVTLSLLVQGLPAAGSVNFGLGFTMCGLVFAGIAMVAAQITDNARVVYGAAGAVLGASFVVRGIGDVGNGVASWFSPIGWSQKARPFAGEKWWPFLVPLVATAVCVIIAHELSERRDLGGGLVQPRPGPPVASNALGRPLGLAVRLQRGSLVGWSLGLAAMGAVYGSIVSSIEDFIGNNKGLADILAKSGGASITDSYLAMSSRILALIAAGFAVAAALRLRSEETALRAEPVLATPTSRLRWTASHLAVAFVGGVLVLAVAGLGLGIAYAIVGGGLAVIGPAVVHAAVYAPAVWLLVGVAVAAFGLVPRLAAVVAWLAVTACFVIGMLGQLLSLPQWVNDVSPFEHVPQLPAESFSVIPFVLLGVVAAALTAVGLAAFRRRDVG